MIIEVLVIQTMDSIVSSFLEKIKLYNTRKLCRKLIKKNKIFYPKIH